MSLPHCPAGKTKLFNTNVKLISDSISGGDTYLGNVDPGATANVDAYVQGVQATMDDGMVQIVISYEDESGNVSIFEKEFELYVSEPYYEEWDPNMEFEDIEEIKGGFKWWYVIVPVVLLVIASGLFIFLKKRKLKKARQLEEDLLDDDLFDDKDNE